MILKSKILPILFLFVIVACKDVTPVEKEALVQYLQDESNGLFKEIYVGKMKLEVSYQPSELVWYRDLKSLTTVSAIDSLMNSIKDRYYFSVSYSIPNDESFDPLSMLAGDKKFYDEVLSNFSFRYGEYVTIKLSDGESVNAQSGIFSNTYGMLPYNTVTFYFNEPRIENEETIFLSVEDIGFEIGKQKITFKNKDIRKVPTLKL